MMIVVHVSLGVRSLAYIRLNPCLRGCDNIHNLESLEERGRGNGPETRPGAKSPKREDVIPNLPALGGGEEVRPSGTPHSLREALRSVVLEPAVNTGEIFIAC